MKGEPNNRILIRIKNVYEFILGIFYPKYCVGCSIEGTFLCNKCSEKIVYIKTPVCPKCNRLSVKSCFCRKCKKSTRLNGLIVGAYYENPLKEAIHKFKYENIYELKDYLGKIMTSAMHGKFIKNSLLIPVPLSRKREAERGYNQSFLLAKEISKTMEINIINKKLKRIIHTDSQVSLTGKKRNENIKNAFRWVGKDEIKGKNILLVDDVYTTGSTLNECAKELKKAGAKEVWGLVLAKG